MSAYFASRAGVKLEAPALITYQTYTPTFLIHHTKKKTKHASTTQTSSSNMPSNSSLANGTLNLSVPIPSFRDSTIW